MSVDLCDFGHLYVYGAEKSTKTIGKYLVQEFGLESHKGQEGYESWDEDYALYLRDYTEMTAQQEG